jgi:copper chaperone CopZ
MKLSHVLLTLAIVPSGALVLGGCGDVVTYAARDVEFRVEGMVCESCENTIQTALGSIEGVVSCRASHAESKVVVSYQPAKANPEELAAAIRAAGYTVPNTP